MLPSRAAEQQARTLAEEIRTTDPSNELVLSVASDLDEVAGAVAGGEVEKGLPGLGDDGEDEAEVGELSGAAAVLEGVEVAGFTTGTGAAATTPTGGAGGLRWCVGSGGHGVMMIGGRRR